MRSWADRHRFLSPLRSDTHGIAAWPESRANWDLLDVSSTIMIGPKKLSQIRAELKDALAATGEDPLVWLEKRMTSPEHPGSDSFRESEVLHSLRRFLEGTARKKRAVKRVRTKQ
jgi:hypothetical protein